jgi:hypothetical protein
MDTNWLKSRWKSLSATLAGASPGLDPIADNFTPRAQQVVALARKEADRFHHNFVGTEHLLLGLISLGQGVAVNVLQKLGVDLNSVRQEVERLVGTGPDQKVIGSIPFTPRVKKVLALAALEAKALNHTYVGTEHILLGLLREGGGVAAVVLSNLEVDIEQTRQEILRELDPNFQGTFADANPSPADASFPSQRAGSLLNPQMVRPSFDPVDTKKRYDIYCTEGSDEIVVYRNALIKGRKGLLAWGRHDFFSDFLELEQADGRTIFIATRNAVKFCEAGGTSAPEDLSGTKH